MFRSSKLGWCRPFVTVTFAQSLDGSISTRRGVPTRLSGHASMVLTHKLRALHHAILVGVGTVLADDPSLTVRLVPGTNPQPVILDTHLRCPLDSKLLSSSRCKRPIIITTDFSLRGCSRRGDDWVSNEALKKKERRCRLESAGAKVWTCKSTASGRIDLQAALALLSHYDSLMVEGGARILNSFFQNSHTLSVDEVLITLAPCLIGGLNYLEPNMPFRLDLENPLIGILGKDTVISGSTK